MGKANELSRLQRDIKKRVDAETHKKPVSRDTVLWFEFASQNRGFQFLKLGQGRKLTALEFFHRFHKTPYTLNLATENCFEGWRRVVKPGWTVVDIGYGTMEAVRDENIPTYKKGEH